MISEEWQTYKLEEVLEALIDYRGKTPKKTNAGIPLITAKIVKNGTIMNPKEFISEKDYDSWMVRGLPKSGDVVLTTEAPLGEVAQLINSNVALAQRIVTLRGKANVLDNGFLKYFLMSSIGQSRLKERESGTTVTGIKQSELRLVEINMPDYNSQKRISKILASIDEKIELSNAIKKNLEKMSQALFKQWFVGFEFPNENGEPYKSSGGEFEESELGLIPKGWRVGIFSELVNVKYGKDHKKLDDGSIPVYGSGGVMRYVDKVLYSDESVLIPRKGTLNNVIYVNEPFWSVDTMFYTVMNVPYIAKFIYFFVSSKDLVSMNVGSAIPSMTTDILNKMPVVIPREDVLEKFDRITSALFDKIYNLIIENKKLLDIRDSLLPKLILGEIRV
ncbi:restriction endonuclease subunit S [Paenibacillus sp. BAC0078]